MPAPLEATMFAIVPSHPEVGDMSLKVWPHLSVMPWVQLGDVRHEVLEEAQEIFAKSGPVLLKPGRMKTVGAPGHEKRAQAIRSEELKELHMKLLYSLGSYGVVVSHPEWAGQNYSPHMTHETPLLLEETYASTIYVIDNLQLKPGEGGTKVISKILRASEA